MTIGKIFVILGGLINFSHEAAIVCLPPSAFNRSIDFDSSSKSGFRANEDFCPSDDYVRLPLGADVYFYVMKDENLLLGPKLQSEEDIDISFVKIPGHLSDYRKRPPKQALVSNSVTYVVLKSGILMPRINCPRAKSEKELLCQKRNSCVYESIHPVYYVRGFKDILIPADVLYSKAVQEEMFNKRNWKSESPIEVSSNLVEKWGCVPPENGERENGVEGRNVEEGERGEEEEEEVFPDRNCSGEVTLFLLKSDGVLKRVTADPYMPIGLHLTYSLLDNLILQPKFLGGSDLMMSYVTGENGDLIPHPRNAHSVTAEVGTSVLFMLSKNGGLFPVKEEKRRDKLVRYYFEGKLIHETRQSLDTYSNSTTVLINKEKYQLFRGEGTSKGTSVDSECQLEDSWRKKSGGTGVSRNECHRLRKREAYLNGCERGSPVVGHSQNGMETQSAARHGSTDGNRLVEYSGPLARNHGLMMRRQHPALGSEMAAACHAGDSRYSDVAEDHGPGNGKLIPPVTGIFEGIRKAGSGPRDAVYSEPADPLDQDREEMAEAETPSWDRPLLKSRTDLFIFDEKGTKIRLIPEITDSNDVVIYKLTCKGNLVRYPSCKEPEFGFEINFQLLLDEFVLVPTLSTNKPYHITYVLQENGDLVPTEENENTFRKAPGSLIYYMLGKNNVLFPVQQVIDMDGYVSFFFQNSFLLKMKDTVEKPLHFTTKGSPLFAFFNGLTMISMSSRPRLKARSGSNWNQLKPSEPTTTPPKTMYLTGPKGELIRVTPYKNRQDSTVIYELDCNGILYRSPKDKKKCIILKSYILLKEGILLPSNDTNGYVYMMSKNGDLFPYLYPDGKIEAPLASSLKYVLCEKGILLPIKLEIIDNYICYFFRDVLVYKEKVHCRISLDRLNESQLYSANNYKKSSCDIPSTDASNQSEIKLFVNKNGDHVFYQKENKVLKRHPPEAVPSYLKYTMGSFEIKPDGSLYQIRYRDPCENVANLMLEPNGDLLEDTRNLNNLSSEYYLLDAKGNLIAVDAKKATKNIYFYKDRRRVCKVPLPTQESSQPTSQGVNPATTPLGKDPLKLMEDPFPKDPDTRSLYIPIPLNSVSVSNPTETLQNCADPEHRKKCDMLKDTLKQVSKGNSLPLALELELTDDIIEELKNWAAKCDKVLSRREAADSVDAYVTALEGLRGKTMTQSPSTG